MDHTDIDAMSSSPHADSTTPAAPVMSRQTLTRPRRDSWDSRKLLDGRSEIRIRHNGETYTLHHTQAGKLLLTK